MRKARNTIFTPGVFSILTTIAVALFFWLTTYFFNESKIVSFAYWDIKIQELDYRLLLLLSFVLCLCCALFLNRLVNRFALIQTQTDLPGLFLVTLVGANKALQTNVSALCGLLILIIVLWQLLLTYHRRAQGIRLAFNIMLLLAAASFICFELLFLIPIFFIGFFMFQSAGWRVFISAILGILTSVLMLTAVFYLFDNVETLLEFVNHNLQLQYQLVFTVTEIMYYSLLLFLLVIAIIQATNSFYKKTNHVRRGLSFFLVCIFALLALFLFRLELSPQVLTLASLFSAFFLAHFFSLNLGGFIKMIFWLYIAASFAYFANTTIGILVW